jgi:hypothetical protein
MPRRSSFSAACAAIAVALSPGRTPSTASMISVPSFILSLRSFIQPFCHERF